MTVRQQCNVSFDTLEVSFDTLRKLVRRASAPYCVQ